MNRADPHGAERADVMIAAVRLVALAVDADVGARASARTREAIEAAADVFVPWLNLDGVTPKEAARRATIIALAVAVPMAMQHADERR